MKIVTIKIVFIITVRAVIRPYINPLERKFIWKRFIISSKKFYP